MGEIMSKVITVDKERSEELKSYLSKMLENEKAGGVLSLRRLNNGVIDYGLISEVGHLEHIEPFYPIMPANAGQLLSRFTPMGKPIVAVIKPCEFRAFVEMVKRKQMRREDFYIITYSCGGVYPLKKNAVTDIDSRLQEYEQALCALEIPEGIRASCRGCEHLYSSEADVYISLAGNAAGSMKIYLQSDKSLESSGFWRTGSEDGNYDEAILHPLLSKREAGKREIFAEVDTGITGLDGLIDIFGKCIGCHGCNSVCPICYCALCDFESFNYDYNRLILEKELSEKGALRLPPDTLFFHLGRLSHMSFSCVGCGMCSDVCPAMIPVAQVFKKIGEETAAMFDFVSGRSISEEIPVMIYKEEEFPELGE